MKDNKNRMSVRIVAGILVFLMAAVAVAGAIGLIFG